MEEPASSIRLEGKFECAQDFGCPPQLPPGVGSVLVVENDEQRVVKFLALEFNFDTLQKLVIWSDGRVAV